MGAEFDYREYRTLDRSEIERQWQADVKESRFESGNSYSGEIGMLGGPIDWLPGAPAESQSAAVDILADKHQKWDGPMAVRFADGWVVGGWCSS